MSRLSPVLRSTVLLPIPKDGLLGSGSLKKKVLFPEIQERIDTESVMCDVIKIRLNSYLFGGFSFPLLLSSLLVRRIFFATHVTLSVSPKKGKRRIHYSPYFSMFD